MLQLEQISKTYDDQPVLNQVSLRVEEGEIMCLLGPSGCGKTTLLRAIAGLEPIDQGKVLWDGEDITTQEVKERGFGLMFQDFALFPHMNVAGNVAFGLEMQNLSKDEKDKRVAEVLELVGLVGFDKRSVDELSGGEQQRVALARSLAPKPKLLMLDEPLGSLDAALRERLVIELREIIKAAGITAVYVTHDQHEAFMVADRIAVMNAGQIEQIGSPDRLYLRPKTQFVAEFLGLQNIVPVNSVISMSEDEPLFVAKTALGEFIIGRPAELLLLHPLYLEVIENDSATVSNVLLWIERKDFQGSNIRLIMRHKQSDLLLTMNVATTVPQIPDVGNPILVRYHPNGGGAVGVTLL